jgi:hypothetical protein
MDKANIPKYKKKHEKYKMNANVENRQSTTTSKTRPANDALSKRQTARRGYQKDNESLVDILVWQSSSAA